MDSNSQLNDEQVNKTGTNSLMTIVPHLRSVDKGAFLLLREGITSPMRAKFYSYNH